MHARKCLDPEVRQEAGQDLNSMDHELLGEQAVGEVDRRGHATQGLSVVVTGTRSLPRRELLKKPLGKPPSGAA